MRFRSGLIAQIFAVSLLVGGCNSRAGMQQVSANGAGGTGVLAATALPPAIVSDHTYRCDDDSVVRIEYLAGDQGALLQPPDNGTPVRLTADETGGNLTGSGYVVAGRGTAIVFQRPAGSRQHCKG
ncbi:hypothetical protein ACM61V_16005 [Sphingomonas sp. TX0543]|jgi:hypothetical protein